MENPLAEQYKARIEEVSDLRYLDCRILDDRAIQMLKIKWRERHALLFPTQLAGSKEDIEAYLPRHFHSDSITFFTRLELVEVLSDPGVYRALTKKSDDERDRYKKRLVKLPSAFQQIIQEKEGLIKNRFYEAGLKISNVKTCIIQNVLWEIDDISIKHLVISHNQLHSER